MSCTFSSLCSFHGNSGVEIRSNTQTHTSLPPLAVLIVAHVSISSCHTDPLHVLHYIHEPLNSSSSPPPWSSIFILHPPSSAHACLSQSFWLWAACLMDSFLILFITSGLTAIFKPSLSSPPCLLSLPNFSCAQSIVIYFSRARLPTSPSHSHTCMLSSSPLFLVHTSTSAAPLPRPPQH